MTSQVTIARPYAKAIFEYAMSHNQLQTGAPVLHQLSIAIQTPEVKAFIMNPGTTSAQHIDLLMHAVSSERQKSTTFPLRNFLETLALHKRLLALPEIYQLFEAMRAEHEKVQTVHVVSFSPLSDRQQEKLRQSLSQRLKREVSIEIKIDHSLIGGAIIHAGDLVINGSVRDKLLKLGADLVA